MRPRALLGVLVLAAAHPGCRAAPEATPRAEPSIDAELDGLIAAANAHDSFRLVYRGTLESSGGGSLPVTLEIAHQAPRRAFVRMAAGRAAIEVLLDGPDYFLRQGGGWRHARIPEHRALSVFEELMPSARTIGPGATLNFKETGSFWFPVAWSQFGRQSFFGFLGEMVHDHASVVRDGGTLTWSSGARTVGVSRTTGFPASLRMIGSLEGLQVELSDVELGVDLTERLAIVEPARAVVDAEIQSVFDEQYAHRHVRYQGFVRLRFQLREGQRTLDDPTRAAFRTFLDVHHAEALDLSWGGWLADMRSWTDELAAWARASDPAAARERAEQHRRVLETHLDQTLESYAQRLVELPGGDVPAELYELERAVVERLHAERVSRPVLAYYDQQLAAALGD